MNALFSKPVIDPIIGECYLQLAENARIFYLRQKRFCFLGIAYLQCWGYAFSSVVIKLSFQFFSV